MLLECLIIFMMGAVIGSFLNVCIHRIPDGKSIINPPSACPACGKRIKPWHNIPVLSYIFLGGKCRYCRAAISPRYLLVELLTPCAGILLFLKSGLGYAFFVQCILAAVLIVIMFIDIKHRIVPDVLSLPGILVGLLLNAFIWQDCPNFSLASLVNSVCGVLAGGASILCMGVLGKFIFKKEAVGGGDVKLMAMIGAFIGGKLGLLTFFLAPVLGSIAGVYILLKQKQSEIAYAPYIVGGAFISMLWGERITTYLFPC
ncbi:MAG: prepilin peptidase [Candidatus Omnitrophica bacterium]|nr:prepilin peptidase [Candidatus Omnitrophota bacterium]